MNAICRTDLGKKNFTGVISEDLRDQMHNLTDQNPKNILRYQDKAPQKDGHLERRQHRKEKGVACSKGMLSL